MKILIVSNSPWRNDNSFGNSFSNIFEGIQDLEIANVYCKYGFPENNVASHFFQITEKSIISNLLKGTPSGKKIDAEKNKMQESDDGETSFNKIKRYKNLAMYWARAAIWKTGRWKSQELIEFLDDFKPDLLFIPIYHSYYLHDINRFVLERYGIPAVGYVSDDVYTLKQFSLSPLYWLDKIILRPTMRRVFSWCKVVYVISEVQKREYTALFGDKFKLLTKCKDFSDENRPALKDASGVIRLLYAGNISKGRLYILKRLAQAISHINADNQKMKLDIYSSTPLKESDKRKLMIENCCEIHPPVSYDKVMKLIEESDVLIHAEAFSLKESLAVHQSFSTKIVDYVAANRCIFAIGSERCASIQYFKEHRCGFIAERPDQILTCLETMLKHPEKFREMADCAWNTGKFCHDKEAMQSMLHNDLIRVLEMAD